jgi:tRNA dimethylallyltransferase
LAKKWNTLILSADSRQFYKELSIGTAKPTLEEQEGVIHHFIDSHALTDELTSASYATEAQAILTEEFKKHERILMVGGSGMFIDAVCIGLDNIPTDKAIRHTLTTQWKEEGIEPLLTELKEKDVAYFNTVDKANPPRIIRALEAIRITGKSYSELRVGNEKTQTFEVRRFVIDHPREKLYDRINLRVDQMIESGLLDEVKSVIEHRQLQTLNTVGYKELFSFIDDAISFKQAIDLIKQNTRRYAKRQLTWFRRHPEAKWIPYSTALEMAESIDLSLKQQREKL